MVGFAIGSFLNVCIYRIPRGESIISPSSHCIECGKKIRWYDNLPVLSYIILKGRCRDCGEIISIMYPLIEFLAGLVLITTFMIFGFTKDFFLYGILFIILIPIAFIDYTENIIPNSIILFGSLIGLIIPIANGFDKILSSVIGGLGGVFCLYTIRFIGNKILKKESMGLGDIKLAGMLGIFLGRELIFIAIYISFLIALLYGLIMIFKKKSIRIKPLPFGTFLAVSSIITVFFGEFIVGLYYQIIW